MNVSMRHGHDGSGGLIRHDSVIYETSAHIVGVSSNSYSISSGQLAIIDKYAGSDASGIRDHRFYKLVELSGNFARIAKERLEADGVNILITLGKDSDMPLHSLIVPRYERRNAEGTPMVINSDGQQTEVGRGEAGLVASVLKNPMADVPEDKQVLDDSNDIFCRKVRLAEEDIVYSGQTHFGRVIAVPDMTPGSLGHTVVMPYDHYSGIDDMRMGLLGDVGTASFVIAKRLLRGIEDGSGTGTVAAANKVFINFNFGIAAGQNVPHVHAHVRSDIPAEEGRSVNIDLNGKRDARVLTPEEFSRAVIALRRN